MSEMGWINRLSTQSPHTCQGACFHTRLALCGVQVTQNSQQVPHERGTRLGDTSRKSRERIDTEAVESVQLTPTECAAWRSGESDTEAGKGMQQHTPNVTSVCVCRGS